MAACKNLNNVIWKLLFHLFHTVKATGEDDMTNGAIREVVSPVASLGTASDVSPSHPSSKDEGVSNDTFFHYHIGILDFRTN